MCARPAPLIAALAFACGTGGQAPRDTAAAHHEVTAAANERNDATTEDGLPFGPVSQEQILRGRALVIHHACGGGCHGAAARGQNPAAEGWLTGTRSPDQEFLIGACTEEAPDAEPCFRTRPRNLTPDNLTGLGRFSERQIFNALRFGLRPGETPDVEITSTTPGVGNYPEYPKYLAIPMPWPAWRHMEDQELWDIVAYLKHGLRPVRHQVEDSEGPPDFWAGEYTVDKIGSYPAPPFPTTHETTPPESRLQQVLRGRKLVLDHACSACHGGVWTPGQEGWLVGARTPDLVFREDGLRVLPRNLTPHPTLGTGGYTERQIFNALRFGLRPGETPDVEITSSTPGEGHFPEEPRYLSLAMPWLAWRHMPDEDLWAIAAYLKHGVRPVAHEVPESEVPPDFWASRVTPERIGPHPAPPFPTANETVVPHKSQRK